MKAKKKLKTQRNVKDLIRTITINLDECDEKYIKVKFILESYLNEKIKIPCMTIVIRASFLNDKKYYPQVFLYECLYKI